MCFLRRHMGDCGPCPPWGRLIDKIDHHPEIHQATGMVSVQLGIRVADALARLEARAFALDRAVADLADDIVARRFRFDE